MTDAAAGLVAHRSMLYGLAYRILGSAHDADDVLQDAYLRWRAADRSAVADPRRYLSRVVTHLAMDVLRRRQAARETYVGPWLPEPVPSATLAPDEAAEQRESLSIAALHLLERLTPAQRAVFVLHTAFGLPYAEIAEALGRSVADCRQLHRRAAARLADGTPRARPVGPAAQRRLLTGLLAAARQGDVAALTAMLAADVTVWSDGGGRVKAAPRPVHGAAKVARFLAGVYAPEAALDARPVDVNGGPAVVVRTATMFHVVALAAHDGGVSGIYLISNPDKLRLVSGGGR